MDGNELKQPFVREDQIPTMVGAVGGITWSEGISTSICAQAATHYIHDRFGNHAGGGLYLIDAVHLRGFAVPSPRPNDEIAVRFPILRKIYEVNFMHSIPNTSIVGFVWPKRDLADNDTAWPSDPKQLHLAVNPEYEGGFQGAKEVVKRFNKWW